MDPITGGSQSILSVVTYVGAKFILRFSGTTLYNHLNKRLTENGELSLISPSCNVTKYKSIASHNLYPRNSAS